MKKRIFCALLIFVTIFSVICFATENNDVMLISEEETDYVIPEEYRRDGDVMLISEETEIKYTEGDKLIVDDETTTVSNENINGNVFAAVTPKLTIENTTINGNLFVMANTIELKNVHVTGSIFAMAQEFGTNELYVNEVYLLGNHISLNGTVLREVKISAEKVDINGQVNGNVFVAGSDITLEENTVLYKKADINYTNTFNQSETAVCEDLNAIKMEATGETTIDRNEQIKAQITEWIIELVKTLIAVGFVILFTDRKYERFSSKLTAKNYIGLTLKGFLWLIVIPIAAIILIIVSRGYLVGFPILAIVIYLIISYLSLQIVSIAIGSSIKNKKMADKGNIEYIGITLIIMTVVWLLGKLPIIGIIVWFIIVMLSFGIMIKYIFNSKEKKIENKEEPVVELKDKK